MKKLALITLASFMTASAWGQSSSSTNVPLYTSGYLSLPYGGAPGMSDAASLLGKTVNATAFSITDLEQGSRLLLKTLPSFGGESGPESFVSGVAGMHRLNENTTVLAEFSYYQAGNAELRDNEGNELGFFQPSENNIKVGVVQRFSESFRAGVKLGYNSTNLGSSFSSAVIRENALLVDFSADYTKELGNGELVAFWGLNNIGKKNSFSEDNLAYMPTQMSLGALYSLELNEAIKLSPNLTFQKFLVPSTPIRNADGSILMGQEQPLGLFAAMFGSFSDAPNGTSEEVQEWRTLIGTEALINDKVYVAVSASLESQDKGNRQFVSFGTGVNFNKTSVGLGYFVSTNQNAIFYNGMSSINICFTL